MQRSIASLKDTYDKIKARSLVVLIESGLWLGTSAHLSSGHFKSIPLLQVPLRGYVLNS